MTKEVSDAASDLVYTSHLVESQPAILDFFYRWAALLPITFRHVKENHKKVLGEALDAVVLMTCRSAGQSPDTFWPKSGFEEGSSAPVVSDIYCVVQPLMEYLDIPLFENVFTRWQYTVYLVGARQQQHGTDNFYSLPCSDDWEQWDYEQQLDHHDNNTCNFPSVTSPVLAAEILAKHVCTLDLPCT
eukprot:Lankesteria_metandrocarpae@DN8485_c0_g1_i1.p1